ARDLVLRCLRKDPGARFQSAAELRVALEALAHRAPARRAATWWAFAVTAAAILMAAVTMWWPRGKPEAPAQNVTRQVTFDGGITAQAAVSPDGKLLAFASDRSEPGNVDIWLRQISGSGLARLTSQPGLEYNPQFSADGS